MTQPTPTPPLSSTDQLTKLLKLENNEIQGGRRNPPSPSLLTSTLHWDKNGNLDIV